MKSLFSKLLMACAAIALFSACEDVPEPYSIKNGNTDSTQTIQPKGDGTLANPYNVAAADSVAALLSSGEENGKDIYIKGIVSTIKEQFTTTYGNGTFYISDDGTTEKQFYIYRAYYLNNKKFTASDSEINVGDTVIICGRIMNYNSGTYETVQNKSYIYSLNGGGGGSTDESGTAEGDGSLENPYNVTAVNALAASLSSNETYEKDIYIKGVVTSIKEQYNTQYGNGTFYIGDNASSSNTFYIYRALYLGNAKFASGDTEVKVGDEVIIYGKICNYTSDYGTTLETVQNGSYLYSLNGKTADGGTDTPSTGEAKGDGTLANPYNCVAANAYASSLGSNEKSDKDIYIKGKIVSIKENFSTTQYGNSTFYISDDGTSTDQFYVFRTLYLGNVKYTSGNLPQVGDEVVICGKVMNYYGNTPETVQNESYIYSLTSNGGSGETGGETGGEVSGNSISVTVSSFGLDNAAELDGQTLKLTDGTTLTFANNGGKTPPRYYNTGTCFRIYPSNSITIKSSKTISSVALVCDNYNGTIYNASGDLAASPGTIKVKDADVSVTGIANDSVVISNTSTNTGASSQLRITSITITYAE